MKVKELIIRLLDEPMDAEVNLCTDYDKEEVVVKDYDDVKVVNCGVIFDIDEIEHWNGGVTINFTDWRKGPKTSRYSAERKERTMKTGDEVYVHGFIDEIRNDVIIIRNDGGYFGTAPSEVVDQEETLQNLTKPNKSDLIVKGAGEIKDGLYNIKDGKLFKYKANGGTVRTYPIVDRPIGE